MRSSLRRGLTLNGVHQVEVEVGRLSVFEDLLKVYRENPSIVTKEVRVRFRGEPGIDGGLFWQSAQERVFEGNLEKIPIITPETTKLRLLVVGLLSGFIVCVNIASISDVSLSDSSSESSLSSSD